ncbi:dihydrolipoyl dehydrogenase [Mesoplasma seiffertii]|uniref:dihydrolipoyl dehydrogenase n=1 Tax=Mesoplasma seiffertii TaxID=28224 RepID=UPI0012EC9EBE|nr:dihydrolipoyl dehydrogenase [Mesoplasma seiffertii]
MNSQNAHGTCPLNSNSQPKLNNIEDKFDVVVIGGGIGGYVCAIKCAQLGLKTMIVEKNSFGGVCLNIGCIPTKALLKTAKVFDQIVKAEKFGIEFENDPKPKLNWSKAQDRKNSVVKKLTTGVEYLLKKNKVVIIKGDAEVTAKNVVTVGDKNYEFKNIVLATGSVPITLNLPGFDKGYEAGTIITSTEALSLPKIPDSIVIIGGGVIGVEFACLYAQLGTKVTLLQGLPTILEMLDEDIIAEMTKVIVNKYGINLVTNAKVKELSNNELIYEVDGKDQKVKADYILQSVGRKTVAKGFDILNLKMTERNAIDVNDYCETNVSGVYAIGDVTGKSMLAHVASHQGLVVANRIAKNLDLKMNYDRIPSCIYTSPEIAAIGKTEKQLKDSNIKYEKFNFPFAAIGKALADDDSVGFVKLIMDPETKVLLGAHIIGNRATEMISEITTLIECEGTIYELARAIHPHPTMSEAIGEAAEALESGKPLNL